jgi:choline transport protein
MLFSIIGTMALALSLAEMASICPIAGAQYHWTALFAPPKIKNFITWMQGEEMHPRNNPEVWLRKYSK